MTEIDYKNPKVQHGKQCIDIRTPIVDKNVKLVFTLFSVKSLTVDKF